MAAAALRGLGTLVGSNLWASKCVIINACGSAVDFALLLITASLLHWPTALAGAVSLATGSTFNFLLNRRFTFGGCALPWHVQAIRYGLMIAGLMVVHSALLVLLRDVLGVMLVPSKILADVVVFGVPQPFILRRFVFPCASPVPTAVEAMGVP